MRMSGLVTRMSKEHCIMATMANFATPLPAPLTEWNDGTIRVGSSRVLLGLVVHHFKQGATAEQIQHSFPSLTLREVYGAIYYYLAHADEVEAYLAGQERQADEVEHAVRGAQRTTAPEASGRATRAPIQVSPSQAKAPH